MNDLPDELKASETLAQYDTSEAALQGLVDTKAHLGNSIRIPPDDAGDDALDSFVNKLIDRVPSVMLKPDFENDDQTEAFYRTIGKPETPDKYVNPEGISLDPEQESGLRAQAHAMNMTGAQYKLAAKRMSDGISQQTEASNDAKTESMNNLKGEWGSAFDERMALARKLHEQNFGETGVAFADVDPTAIRGLYTTALALAGSDNKEFASQPTGETPGMDPGEAQMQIQELLSNKEHPYWDPAKAGHEAAQRKMLKLQAAAAGRSDEAFMAPITVLRSGGP